VSKLTEVRENLVAKQREMNEIVKTASVGDGDYDFSKVKGHGFEDRDSKGQVEHFNAMHAEMKALAAEANQLKQTADAAREISDMGDELDRGDGRKSGSRLVHAGGEQTAEAKSLGELFTDSEAYTKWRRGAAGPEVEIDLAKQVGGGSLMTGVKAIMTTSAGWAPQNIRTGRMVDLATAPIDFLDVIPTEATDQAAVVYMEETTFTNNAAEALEGGTYAQAALALTERTSPVRKIAVYLPVTDEQLEDIAQVQSYINNRLPFMVRQRLNLQALKGNGASPNIEGLQVRAGVQTYALSAEPVFDAVAKAMDLVLNTGQAIPDAFVPNSSDWIRKFRLARTPDGIYLLGNPNDAQAANSLWGMTVAPTQQQTTGTGLLGSFAMFSGLAWKKNVTLSVGYVNDDFIKGQQSIRCEIRVAVQSYRPAAFATVTNL